MECRNQRGQILIESVFLVGLIAALLIAFQVMIDHQKNESSKYRLSKYRKENLYDEKNDFKPSSEE